MVSVFYVPGHPNVSLASIAPRTSCEIPQVNGMALELFPLRGHRNRRWKRQNTDFGFQFADKRFITGLGEAVCDAGRERCEV